MRKSESAAGCLAPPGQGVTATTRPALSWDDRVTQAGRDLRRTSSPTTSSWEGERCGQWYGFAVSLQCLEQFCGGDDSTEWLEVKFIWACWSSEMDRAISHPPKHLIAPMCLAN